MKFDEDISTHSLYNPRHCLNVIASDGPNKNKTYSMPMILEREMSGLNYLNHKHITFQPSNASHNLMNWF